MTGCAAWYDLSYIGKNSLKEGAVEHIGVSEPARVQNYESYLDLIKYLQSKFPKAKITAVFHRGMSADKYTSNKQGKKLEELSKKIGELGVEIRDISYGAEGFTIYDSFDLHIGYRVHAHIYNLSHRRKSILIEEDSRGAGVNNALGLNEIRAYEMKAVSVNNKIIKRGLRKFDSGSAYMLREIDDYIERLEENNCEELKNAFERMEFYFEKMLAHLLTIKNGI